MLAIFSQYGELVDVNLVKDKDTGAALSPSCICCGKQSGLHETMLHTSRHAWLDHTGRQLAIEVRWDWARAMSLLDASPLLQASLLCGAARLSATAHSSGPATYTLNMLHVFWSLGGRLSVLAAAPSQFRNILPHMRRGASLRFLS